MLDKAFNWAVQHPEVSLFALWAIASAIGAILPADSKFGQWCRKWAADLRAKKLPEKKTE